MGDIFVLDLQWHRHLPLYLRIQRAIAYLLKERKASLLAQGMLGTALGMPLATAPAFFLNVGLPFHAGALMVPGALTQPLPIKLLSGGF